MEEPKASARDTRSVAIDDGCAVALGAELGVEALSKAIGVPSLSCLFPPLLRGFDAVAGVLVAGLSAAELPAARCSRRIARAQISAFSASGLGASRCSGRRLTCPCKVVTTAPVAHGTRTARSSAARQLTDTSQLAKRRPKRLAA